MNPRVIVVGPAYLDRVLRVDAPLLDPDLGGPLDLSAEGAWLHPLERFETLTLIDPEGGTLEIDLPPDWPEGHGQIVLSRPLVSDSGPWRRRARGVSWHDDLGGMGAGYAAALGGELISALGPETDPASREIARRLAEARIAHHPVRVSGRAADWTLLITSGPHGDKLPIGFRGCHAVMGTDFDLPDDRCDVLVVASLTNPVIASALDLIPAQVRVFAPTLRNMGDSPPLREFAHRIDLLCCNRREWEALDDREAVAGIVPLILVTDGPIGSTIRFRDPSGVSRSIVEPAFPRSRPPRDTNRAGESYASTFIHTLLDAGWGPNGSDPDLIRLAARRGAASAAIVLDLEEFGFPTPDQIDAALRRGSV